MNLCRACRRSFSSVAAFDRHRSGTHAYTFREGLDLGGYEDGRRCLDPDEMLKQGMSVNGRGSWQIDASVESARSFFQDSAIR